MYDTTNKEIMKDCNFMMMLIVGPRKKKKKKKKKKVIMSICFMYYLASSWSNKLYQYSEII